MEKSAAATAPTPKPDPLDVCATCGKPIDVEQPVWIIVGAGVAYGVECDTCR